MSGIRRITIELDDGTTLEGTYDGSWVFFHGREPIRNMPPGDLLGIVAVDPEFAADVKSYMVHVTVPVQPRAADDGR